MSTSLIFFFSHFALVSEREDTIHICSLPVREPHISYNGEMSGGFLIHLTDGRRRRRPHDTIHPLIRSAVQFRENLVCLCWKSGDIFLLQYMIFFFFRFFFFHLSNTAVCAPA